MKKLINAIKRLKSEVVAKLNRTFANYIFILKKVWEATPKYLVLLVIIAVLGAVFPIIPLLLMKIVLDLLAAGGEQSARQITLILITVGVLGFLARFTDSLRTFYSNITVKIVEKHINLLILNKASTIDLNYVDSKDYYFKLDNARRALGRRWDTLVLAPVNLFAHTITLCGFIGILLGLRIWLVIVLVLGIIPNIIVQIKTREIMNRFYTTQVPENRKINYVEHVLTDKSYAKEVRLFNTSKYFIDRVGVLFDKRYSVLNKLYLRELKWNGWCSLLSFLTIAICQIAIALFVLNREISIGSWTLYTGALQSINFNLSTAINIIANSYEEKLFSTVLNEFLNVTPKLEADAGEPYLQKRPSVIEFRNVGFCYPDTDRFVIKNISFKIKYGEKIALVGLNGAGKTTLVKLLTRLYDPTEGQILFDDVDIRTYKANDIYKLFGAVFQDFSQYAFTLKENITISCLDNKECFKMVKEAAGYTGLEQMVSEFPQGYDTYITKEYESCGISNLSGGQWQKIALARGFFREAPVIILDEPTSSLDPLAEYEVFQNFLKLCFEKTAFIISHRLSSVRMADKIFFLSEGNIIEAGTHSELITLKGEYAKLFNLQAEQYNIDSVV